jgi:long-chain fatty acid transport protein
VDIEFDLGTIDFSVPPADSVQDPGFSDLVIPRFGVEAQLVDGTNVGLVGRAGYFFEDSPAPDQPGLTNYADAAKHGFSLGLGLRFSDISEVFPKPLSLDLAFLYILMESRDYLKDDVNDLIGDYSIDGDIFGAALLFGMEL